MDWVQIVNSVGFPVSLCGALLYAFYRIGAFLAPLITNFVAAQMDLVASLKETTARQTGILETQADSITEQRQKINEIHDRVIRDRCRQTTAG